MVARLAVAEKLTRRNVAESLFAANNTPTSWKMKTGLWTSLTPKALWLDRMDHCPLPVAGLELLGGLLAASRFFRIHLTEEPLVVVGVEDAIQFCLERFGRFELLGIL